MSEFIVCIFCSDSITENLLKTTFRSYSCRLQVLVDELPKPRSRLSNSFRTVLFGRMKLNLEFPHTSYQSQPLRKPRYRMMTSTTSNSCSDYKGCKGSCTCFWEYKLIKASTSTATYSSEDKSHININHSEQQSSRA